MKTWLMALGWLTATMTLWSCGKECEPCSSCPDLVGEYFCDIQELSDDCADWDLLVGDIRLRVISQTESALQMEVTDNHGLWAVFDGFLCQAEGTAYPLDYPFNLAYRPPQSGDEIVDYLLSGYFHIESDGATPAPYATLVISHRNDTSTCRLRGTITPRSPAP